jgi:hypothetical protein
VVSQVPLIDGWHRGRTFRERMNWGVIWRTAQFTVAAIHDILRSRLGQQPYFVSVVAKPGHTAVFTEPEAMETFEALGRDHRDRGCFSEAPLDDNQREGRDLGPHRTAAGTQ